MKTFEVTYFIGDDESGRILTAYEQMQCDIETFEKDRTDLDFPICSIIEARDEASGVYYFSKEEILKACEEGDE